MLREPSRSLSTVGSSLKRTLALVEYVIDSLEEVSYALAIIWKLTCLPDSRSVGQR